MKITKRTIDKAINFLETIPEEGFCDGEQTKDDNPDNIGKCHCVIGWLGVAPQSPFFREDFLLPGNICVAANTASVAESIDNLTAKQMGGFLFMLNDDAPEGQIKATVINALCLLKEQL
jgi:hypothetical protein